MWDFIKLAYIYSKTTRRTVFTQKRIIDLMLMSKSYLQNIVLGYTLNITNPNNSRPLRRIRDFENEGYDVDPLLNRRIAVDLNYEEGKEEIEEEKENTKEIDQIIEQLLTIGCESSHDVKSNYKRKITIQYRLSIENEMGRNY